MINDVDNPKIIFSFIDFIFQHKKPRSFFFTLFLLISWNNIQNLFASNYFMPSQA